jgi:dihydrodipicolinate synthase/N-acetylneuraminate lyase
MNAATETANALAELTDAMLQAVKADDWSLMTELDGQRLAAIDAFKHQKCNDKVDKEVMDRLRLLDEQLRSTAHAARDDVADKLRELRQQNTGRDAYIATAQSSA